MSNCFSDFWYLDWFWSYGRKTEPLCQSFSFFGCFLSLLPPTDKNSKFWAHQNLMTTVSEVFWKFGWNRSRRFWEILLKKRATNQKYKDSGIALHRDPNNGTPSPYLCCMNGPDTWNDASDLPLILIALKHENVASDLLISDHLVTFNGAKDLFVISL